ncbi:uncharacterized protein [Montipora capricornis]|uniref:uncharacterized protein n=1 Tax=Montipora capricornis TaxID=246305 RepID=UPI0035F10170
MDLLVDQEQETAEKKNRLESLATFQLSVLNHALSFPLVKRVVYSTCYVHQEVNFAFQLHGHLQTDFLLQIPGSAPMALW